jgi:5-bromo-4-chloroindolyl phosphate hydrolysis protein
LGFPTARRPKIGPVDAGVVVVVGVEVVVAVVSVVVDAVVSVVVVVVSVVVGVAAKAVGTAASETRAMSRRRRMGKAYVTVKATDRPRQRL